jgi:colicin import membrane protein
MRTATTISVIGHAAALLWAIAWFGAKPYDATPTEALPVDIISAAEFSQITAGSKDAPKAAATKPMVEKVAEAKPVDNPAPKVVDKPEITTASALMPETPPEPVAEPKPAPATQAPPEPKPQEAEKKPDPKPDPIAEALKKDDSKKPEPKKQEAKIPPPPKKPPPQPKADPKLFQHIEDLLDKRAPQRHLAAGEALNPTATLGTSTGRAPELSQSWKDVLMARLQNCWNPPVGVFEAKDLVVNVQFLLKQDGSLSAEPVVRTRSGHPMFQVAAEAAVRAVRACAPYAFLPLNQYEAWKDIDVDFDPKIMNHG